MAYTPPDVHRISNRRGTQRVVDLGFVDRTGIYRLPSGTTISATGDAVDHAGRKIGSSVVVRSDGMLCSGQAQDGLDSAANASNAKHAVDMAYQAAYDANPDSFDANPAAVFSA
ncbi:hypothetical protein AAFP30_22340 [Gordonia sp. CPCC 205515]|uniref:hypothetical protein n=1 Tax=Gordonia sp. CPCC 205515 TaxID=3140791 RepID=UPI003AF38BD2